MNDSLAPPTTGRLRLAGWLFGPVVRSGIGWRTVALVAAMVVAGTGLTLLRLPADARNLLWAEDGGIFLTDAFAHPFLQNLFDPYAGYMHLIPRISAQFVSGFVPLRHLGLAMNLCGAAVWSIVALSAFVFTRGRLWIGFRVLLWLLVLLLPLGSHEVATNTANSHWFLTFGLFWAVCSRGGGVARVVFACCLTVAAVLSDPLTLVFAPFLVARLFALRSLRENAVTIAFVASAVIQLAVVLSTERDDVPIVDPGGLGYLYLIRVVLTTLAGPMWGGWLVFVIGGLVTAVLAGVALALLIAGLVARWGRAGLGVAALGSSIVYFVVVASITWAYSASAPPGSGTDVYWAGRYWVLSGLLFVTATVAVVDLWLSPLLTRTRGRRRVLVGVVAVVVAALLIAPGIHDYRTPGYKADNLQTSTGIELGIAACQNEPPDEPVKIAIAPAAQYLVVPCEIVLTR
ncbi:hypothetical protein N1027_00485 [Herbiconiux sp. CPCC 205763]|uniref:DUF2029 domain-containing protein n=1 Tax=Herbiconiux aconitum TaxID=2970913 RepID=A0ABT2GK63_9MICO|nr:hypothetical protein [Herbiconiux aconitum]MCS5716608.1 hypothetical protein [Herbiconiux aconitum]